MKRTSFGKRAPYGNYHPHDPATYEPLDSEITEDDDMDDNEREAMLADEHYGCYWEGAW